MLFLGVTVLGSVIGVGIGFLIAYIWDKIL